MRLIQPSLLLRRALWADAAVSGLLAVIQLGAAKELAQTLNLPYALLVATGIFLIGYGGMLVALARFKRIPPVCVDIVVLGNLAWATACTALAAGWQLNPSSIGVAYLMMHAVGVLVFAAIEFIGCTRSQTDPEGVSA